MGKIRVNDPIRPRELATIQGERITIPEPEFRTHLQFRRFAGCPGCNLHLRSIAKRHDEILGAGLREVVVFYSSAEAMKPHQGDLPFAIISDPGRALYDGFACRSLCAPFYRRWPGLLGRRVRRLYRRLRSRRRMGRVSLVCPLSS
jgi:peroxiredoxin